jgi:hypothetical protein
MSTEVLPGWVLALGVRSGPESRIALAAGYLTGTPGRT